MAGAIQNASLSVEKTTNAVPQANSTAHYKHQGWNAARSMVRLHLRGNGYVHYFESLGARIVGSSSGGWLGMHAFGREDKSTSASFNINTGHYRDHARGFSLTFFEMLAHFFSHRYGSTWQEASIVVMDEENIDHPPASRRAKSTLPEGQSTPTSAGPSPAQIANSLIGTKQTPQQLAELMLENPHQGRPVYDYIRWWDCQNPLYAGSFRCVMDSSIAFLLQERRLEEMKAVDADKPEDYVWQCPRCSHIECHSIKDGDDYNTKLWLTTKCDCWPCPHCGWHKREEWRKDLDWALGTCPTLKKKLREWTHAVEKLWAELKDMPEAKARKALQRKLETATRHRDEFRERLEQWKRKPIIYYYEVEFDRSGDTSKPTDTERQWKNMHDAMRKRGVDWDKIVKVRDGAVVPNCYGVFANGLPVAGEEEHKTIIVSAIMRMNLDDARKAQAHEVMALPYRNLPEGVEVISTSTGWTPNREKRKKRKWARDGISRLSAATARERAKQSGIETKPLWMQDDDAREFDKGCNVLVDGVIVEFPSDWTSEDRAEWKAWAEYGTEPWPGVPVPAAPPPPAPKQSDLFNTG